MKKALVMLTLLLAIPTSVGADHWEDPDFTEPYVYPTFSGRLAFADSDFCGRPGTGSICQAQSELDLIGEADWLQFEAEVNDERLAGTWEQRFITDQWRWDHDIRYSLMSVENADGSWHGRPTLTFFFQRFDPATTTIILDGAGDYVGLTAMVEATYTGEGTYGIRGRVTDVCLPPLGVVDGGLEMVSGGARLDEPDAEAHLTSPRCLDF